MKAGGSPVSPVLAAGPTPLLLGAVAISLGALGADEASLLCGYRGPPSALWVPLVNLFDFTESHNNILRLFSLSKRGFLNDLFIL